MLESRVRTVEQLAGELGSVRLELETLGAALREGLGCWRAASSRRGGPSGGKCAAASGAGIC